MGFFASDAEIAQSAAVTASMTAYNNGNKLRGLQEQLDELQKWIKATHKRSDIACDNTNMILEQIKTIQAENKELRNKVTRLEEQVNRMAGYTR